MFLSDEGPTFKTLDLTFYIGSTPTFSYLDLYMKTAYAAQYIYLSISTVTSVFIVPVTGKFNLYISWRLLFLESINIM